MTGFFKLKSDIVADHAATGEAITRVSQTAFSTDPNSEWWKFNANTRQWLIENGYQYETAEGKVLKEIPADIEIVPVYDTPNRMHVKVPWSGDLVTHKVKEELDYGNTDEVRSKVVLARYFMRKCR